MTPEDSVWQPQRRTKVSVVSEKRSVPAPLATAMALLFASVVLHAVGFAGERLVPFLNLEGGAGGLVLGSALPLLAILLGGAGQYLCVVHTVAETSARPFALFALGAQAAALVLQVPGWLGWTAAWVAALAEICRLGAHASMAVYVRQLALYLQKYQVVKDAETVLAYAGGLVLLLLLTGSALGSALATRLAGRYVVIAGVVVLVYAGAVVWKLATLLRDFRYELLQCNEPPRPGR